MAELPIQTHRYLMEPLTDFRHIKIKLIKNYLGFIKKVRESSKPVFRQLYSLASRDVRTVTGTNLRNILLLTNKSTVDDLEACQVDSIMYHQIGEI